MVNGASTPQRPIFNVKAENDPLMLVISFKSGHLATNVLCVDIRDVNN